MSEHKIVGTIVCSNEQDRVNEKVQAFIRDLPSLELRSRSTPWLLGEAITDAQGHFNITYTLATLTNGETIKPGRSAKDKAPDISFRVFNSAGQELASQHIEALNRDHLQRPPARRSCDLLWPSGRLLVNR